MRLQEEAGMGGHRAGSEWGWAGLQGLEGITSLGTARTHRDPLSAQIPFLYHFRAAREPLILIPVAAAPLTASLLKHKPRPGAGMAEGLKKQQPQTPRSEKSGFGCKESQVLPSESAAGASEAGVCAGTCDGDVPRLDGAAVT